MLFWGGAFSLTEVPMNNPISLIAYDLSLKDSREAKDKTGMPDRILDIKAFDVPHRIGSFFSCIYRGQLRMHVVFWEDDGRFDNEICALIRQSMAASKLSAGQIWLSNRQRRLIAALSESFEIDPSDEVFRYHSTEYIMPKGSFDHQFDPSLLTARPYEAEHLDAYLQLLNDSMSFFIPPEDFLAKKDEYAELFRKLQAARAFEAFWQQNQLVGLYWLSGTEIDTMGVSAAFQREGHGANILTKAIERVFELHPGANHAVLYAVGWNAKAQRFYQKYGMQKHAYHEVPYTP